jgi:hypothetical protein
MSNRLEGAQHAVVGSDELSSDRRPARWTRTRTIWLLIALGLSPGVVAALFRDTWTALPAGVRTASYLISVILIAAACTLMLKVGDDDRTPRSQSASQSHDS